MRPADCCWLTSAVRGAAETLFFEHQRAVRIPAWKSPWVAGFSQPPIKSLSGAYSISSIHDCSSLNAIEHRLRFHGTT